MANKRGRPSIARTVYGDNSTLLEHTWGNYRTTRSVADNIYCVEAIQLIKEAASDIQNIEAVYDIKKRWYSRGILTQIGRMLVQDRFLKDDVLEALQAACNLKSQKGFSSKEVERSLVAFRKNHKE